MDQGRTIDFTGRVAIVTGGASGMGLAYVHALAARGCAVVVNDVQGAEAVATRIADDGGRALAVSVPVGTADAAHRIAAQALAQFGRLDILINNAGVARAEPFDRLNDANVALQFATNLLGPFELMRAVWPAMAGQGYGRILNIASIGALGIGHSAVYAATKAAMLGLTFDTAIDGRPAGILVNAALPSAYTPMTEQIPDAALVDWYRRHLPAERVAAALLWFVSEVCDVSGVAVTTGGGRIARIGFGDGPAVLDPDISPEAVDCARAGFLTTQRLDLLETQRQASDRYAEVFPREA
ncbi:SDR family NAD(P)-dependent oxidoreductase [Sphingomonas sp. 2378]|uniref:SDR family NAD(P)-dependent oxidoreductase n=1 Tax=Sphingomonas sp. 2378 TaxID=1219748 RepID=UPI00311B00D7